MNIRKRCYVAIRPISATARSGNVPVKDVNHHEESERSMVQRAQRGDEQACAALFQSYKRVIWSICLRMSTDRAEAEDLTQVAFLQVFRSLNSFGGDCSFSIWLYRVAVNAVLMKLQGKSLPVVFLNDSLSDRLSLERKAAGSGLESELFFGI
jgi:RNA polymerase sigma-70 factor, ECF subfamily